MTQLTKKDQIKQTIMNFLNSNVGSVARADINKEIGDLGSSRTISRALAELKLDGLVLQQKDGNTYSWVSTEPKTGAPSKSTADLITESEKKNDAPKKEKAKPAPKKETEPKDAKSDPKPKLNKDINLDDYNKEYIDGIVTKLLDDRKLKPTSANIAKIRTFLMTSDHLTKLDDERAKAKKISKKLTPKDLTDQAKINRNKSAAGKKPAKKTAPKGPGIIATIISAISKKHKTKKQILDILAKTFPEREPEKMMKTINVQVPSRLRKDKGLTIEKTDKGYKVITKS